MSQFKKSDSLKKGSSFKNIQPQVSSKKSIVKEIDKLQKQIENANEDIKKTQKMLDVDLFLKQQKQKRMQYAKQINAEYEQQKKIREEKLYKKFKRDEKQEKNTDKQDNAEKPKEGKDQKPSNEDRIQFKTMNIPVLNPINIVKTLLYTRTDNEWVKEGHHYKPDDIKVEGLRESQQKIFEGWYKNPNEKPKYDGDTESKHIVWKNVKQVAQNSLQIESIPSKIQQNSLIPNDFNSQNILSALALIRPDISKQTFAQNDKILLSQLFAPDGEVTVIVDKQILVREFVHKYVNLGSRAQNLNTLWPTLIEKAYWKLMLAKNMNHLASSICKTVYTFYGIDPQIVPISNKNVIKENFYLVLGHLLQEGAVGLMNVNGHSKKPYENRIYVLQEVKQHVQKYKQEKKEIKFKIKNPWRGRLIDNQNINRFTLLQLLQLFNCVVLLRDYPAKWVCLRINFSYFSNGGVSITNNQWTKNPQYLFTLTKKTTLRIVLRKTGEMGGEKEGVYGFLLFQNKQASNKIQAMKMDWLITKTKSVDLCQASYCAQLGKGNYIVIPYCTDQSTKEYQFYVMDFFIEKESYIQFGKARLFDYNYVDKKGTRLNSGDAKIIQSLESTQRFEKPKVSKVGIPTQFHAKITQKILQSLDLNLFKNCSLKNFYTPGLISNLLINKSIQMQLKQSKNPQENSKQLQNQELSRQEQAQNLEIMLGYDAINDDINQGLMNDYLEQSVGVYDFRDYGLGEEGLTAVLESLALHPQIIQLDLRGNQLNDLAITFLCYHLEKGNRAEIRKLDVSRNQFGRIGKNALEGLKSTFPKLAISGIP